MYKTIDLKHLAILIGRFFTVVVIIITTTGFTIYQHHCNTTGKTFSSIIFSKDVKGLKCDHIELSSQCCKEENKCDIESNLSCCSDFKQYVRADIILTIQQENYEFESPVFQLSNQLSDHNTTYDYVIDIDKIYNYNHPPPLNLVDNILVFLNTWKIDPDPLA